MTMGILDKIFARRRPPSPELKTEIRMPYESVLVPGEEAVAACLNLRKEGLGQFTPVILGDPNRLTMLIEGFKAQSMSPQETIGRANEISIDSFIEHRISQDEELYRNVEVGAWPETALPSIELTGHMDIVTRSPLKTVAICKVPTPNSWEVPAYFSFGNWNECPAPEEHVALLRYWNEKFGVELITLTNDVLECTVAAPPTENDAALKLARQQFIYCSDIVYQGTETLSALGAALKNGTTWYFWWD